MDIKYIETKIFYYTDFFYKLEKESKINKRVCNKKNT